MKRKKEIKKATEKLRGYIRICNYVSAGALLLLAAVILINSYTDFFAGMPALLWTLVGIFFAAIIVLFVCDVFFFVRLYRLKKGAGDTNGGEKKGRL